MREGARFRAWWARWAPALPLLGIGTILLAGSGVWLVRSSFAGIAGGWTLEAWRDVLTSDLNRAALRVSFELATTVATVCTAVGTPLAWYVAGLGERSGSVAQGLLTVVSNFGGASLAIAMVTTLGSAGFVRLLASDWLGVALPFDLYSVGGLVVTYTYFILPLYVLLVLPAVGALKPEWWEAVQVSAGTRWVYWRRIGLPVLSPFILSGWVLTFAWAIGQFSVPYALLGETSTTPLVTTRLGALLFSATGGTNRFQQAAVLSVLLMAISLVALAAYRAVARRMLARLEGAR